MLSHYIAAAMSHAAYDVLSDGTYYGHIPGFQGVWANAATPEGCREELQDVLEGWLLLRVADHLPLPEVDGLILDLLRLLLFDETDSPVNSRISPHALPLPKLIRV